MMDNNFPQAQVRRGRGRPRGAKDKQPRQFHSRTAVSEVSGLMTVEEKVRALRSPAKLSVYATISGLSEAVLRKKIIQGKLNAFARSRMIFVEPIEFLRYWQGGQKKKSSH
jgi:hypothetical protein